MIYVLLTADYELYFGKNFLSYEEILFEPTRKIMNTLENHNIPLNIFPDICSVWRHKEYELLDYVNKFESLLAEAIERGHDIQLHLHPHWLKSIYNGNEWTHDPNTFKLQDYGFGEKSIGEYTANTIIRKGKEYLETLLLKNVSDYQCIAFRAGGYCLQPDDKKLIKALLDAGITIDSTIIPNCVLKTNVNDIDFKDVPDLPNWFISDQGGVKKADQYGIFEIPIPSSTKILPKFKDIAKGILSNKAQEKLSNPPRGSAIQNSSMKGDSFINKNIKRFNYLTKTVGSLECERMLTERGMEYMLSILKDWIQNYSYSDDIWLSIIMHPKSIFQEHIDNLIKFTDKVLDIYSNVQFTTFREVHRTLLNKGISISGGNFR